MEDRDLYRQGIRTHDVGATVNPLEGSWVGSEMWEGRKKEPVEVVKKISMIFKGDEVRVIKDSKVVKGTFTIDHSKKPHRMDLQLKHDGEEIRLSVIFKIEEGRLTICHASGEGGELPGNFGVAEGVIVSSFQKVIPKPKAGE
jgi:uncharacterized protein (TIGR03067 family)